MNYIQVRNFNLSKMGKRSGWCLANVDRGYGISKGKYPSAKADMESQRAGGTLHPLSTLPKNCAVPVYINTTSPYEHVEVCVNGKKWYSDGKEVKAPAKSSVFGWGELCDGVRVVKWVADAKKSNEEIAKEVIAGKWGNGDDRKNRLTSAGYNYNTIQSLVNQMLSGNTSKRKSDTEIAREVIQGKWGNGTIRKTRLTLAGYNYNNIQAIVNNLLR